MSSPCSQLHYNQLKDYLTLQWGGGGEGGRSALGFLILTIFIRIAAIATINFILAQVWLLIKSGSYLRAAYINFIVQCHQEK